MNNQKGIVFHYRVLWHVLFWIVWYFFYVITYASYSEDYTGELLSNLYLLPARVAGTYVLIYYIIPEFLLKRRYVTFSILFIIHALLYGLVLWMILYYFYYCPGCYHDMGYPLIYIPKILSLIIGNYEIPATAALIKFIKRWYVEQHRNNILNKEKLEAELKFLKSQINPHFLFNTLNNLYALTLKKSGKASDVVIRLSKMLDYMLYKSNEAEVKLEDEIKLIKDYLELEKIRYGNRLSLNFKMKGETADHYIAPLILLPFIENSFKHGASRDTSKPFVDISIRTDESCLELHVINSVAPDEGAEEEYSQGIGLKNVKRRLELQYPDRHIFEVSKNDHTFSVLLQIKWTRFNGKCFEDE